MADEQYIWLVEQEANGGYLPVWACESEAVAWQMVETEVAIFRAAASKDGVAPADVDARVEKELGGYIVSRMRVVCRGKAATP